MLDLKEIQKKLSVLETKYLDPLNSKVMKINDKGKFLSANIDSYLTIGAMHGEAFVLHPGTALSERCASGNEFIYRFLLDSSDDIDTISDTLETLFIQVLRLHVKETGAHPDITPVMGDVYLSNKAPGFEDLQFIRETDDKKHLEVRFYSYII